MDYLFVYVHVSDLAYVRVCFHLLFYRLSFQVLAGPMMAKGFFIAATQLPSK